MGELCREESISGSSRMKEDQPVYYRIENLLCKGVKLADSLSALLYLYNIELNFVFQHTIIYIIINKRIKQNNS